MKIVMIFLINNLLLNTVSFNSGES